MKNFLLNIKKYYPKKKLMVSQYKYPQESLMKENQKKFLLNKKKISLFVKNAKKRFNLVGITTSDITKIDFFESLNIDFFKITSGMINNLSLIKKMQSTKIDKIFLSTGLISITKLRVILKKLNLKKISLIHTSFDKNIDKINLKSTIFSSIEAIKKMKKKKWGRIINLTSSTAKEPALKMGLSNVTRSAVASFGKTLSLEVAKYGITVNTILTGGVLTERLENLIKLRINNTNIKYDDEIKRISNNIPVGRIATSKEFVQLILFLSSENSSYVTGTSIPIDGGSSKSIF